MAQTARRHDSPDPATARDDSGAGACLDERSVLAALEQEFVDDPIEQAPRGILFGSLLGAVAWAALIGAWILFLA
jgi:hypothetical protein